MYRFLFDLVLRWVDPERAHGLGKRTLQLVRATSPGRALVRRWVGPPDPILAVRAWGLTFSSPLGVAAGLDKDASWYEDLLALGFGHVEVGTVTALPQAGNPAPRIVRVPDDRALINRMGFPGPGARAVAGHLAGPSRRVGVVGVNVGKSRDVDAAAAAPDYAESVRLLAPLADYLTINVSSPNTPGLRQLQSPDQLRGLVTEVRRQLDQLGRRLPLLIKLAPDLDDLQLDQIAKLALELDLDGIVAVNTTVDRSGLRSDARRLQAFEGGGVSGRPLAPRAEEVLRRLREAVGRRIVLVSAGGVEDADDVWRRLQAGATLIQAYTGFIYGGPGWTSQINRQLAERVRAAGLQSIQDLIHSGVGPAPADTAPRW
jgi:dihydroorotate dehydrogenase